MKRSQIRTWLVFAALGLLGAGALAWVSGVLLDFETEREAAREREGVTARLRLAVWRIDAMLAPMLAQEAARPPDQYRSFYPLGRSYNTKGEQNPAETVLVPSPLLRPSSDLAGFNFQVDLSNKVSSPQVPPGKQKALALDNGVTQGLLETQKERLDRFGSDIDLDALRRRLDAVLASRKGEVMDGWFVNAGPAAQQLDTPAQHAQWKNQIPNKGNDLDARRRAVNRAVDQQQVAYGNVYEEPAYRMSSARISHLVPLWTPRDGKDPALILARRVTTDGGEFIQGVWVDWQRLQAAVRDEVRDLLPEARLVPLSEKAVPDPDRTLAVLPARLEPGAVPADGPAPSFWTPVRVGLATVWIAFLAGLLTVGAGLKSLLALNRRRLEFVSAVTHELRTPLTTFQMYAEMLREGMAPAESRQEYYETLHEESLRLSHLVQNVLDYSRIESQRMAFRREPAPLSEHVARAAPPLEDVCRRKGRAFRLALCENAGDTALLDPSALGQILLNLVDNACKYGEGEVALTVAFSGDRAEFAVTDQGAGLSGRETEALFEPFHRGPGSAEKGPGVGLGLALCRRWARQMGGDLEAEAGAGGKFVLTLPAR